MRTLIYKRTHPGDPGIEGCFGIYDCMGSVRARQFDAVIGVGGMGAEPESHGLDGKINWIGIGPHKKVARGKRGPLVTFDHYVFYGSSGPSFLRTAPRIAHRMYSRNVRAMMNVLDSSERKELQRILALAMHAPPSPARGVRKLSKLEECAPAKPAKAACDTPRVSRAKSVRAASDC